IVAFGDPTGVGNVLNNSVADDLFEWEQPAIADQSVSAVDENGILRIADRRSNDSKATTELPIRISALPIDVDDTPPADSAGLPRSFFAHTDIPVRTSAPSEKSLPARFTASSVPSGGVEAEVEILAKL